MTKTDQLIKTNQLIKTDHLSKIAIDIAILPPKKITDEIIAINKKENERGNAKGALMKNDFYPHLSLAMGTIKKKDLKKVTEIITSISKNYQPLSIELTKLYYTLKNDGSKSYSLKSKKSSEIQKFHEKLMYALSSYFSYDATINELYKKENEETKAPEYINNYLREFSFEKFDPHITLRCTEVSYNNLPIVFTASTIAIFHVGTETTCRKILFQIKLK